MTKMFRYLAAAVVCAGFAVTAQPQSAPTAQKPNPAAQPAAPQSSPNQMTTNPGTDQPPLVPATPEDIRRCGDKVPEGGVPTFMWAETPEKRQERLGTPQDPGCDPDDKTVWSRYGKQYTILRYPRMWANFDMPGTPFLRPFGYANVHRELYQENEKYVWAWEPMAEPDAAPPAENIHKSTQSGRVYTDKEVEVLQRLRSEFFPLKVADSTRKIRFEESSNGLPQDGSWRNGLAVADMNGDGKPDLIVPAERAGGFFPHIFLGDGKGGWKEWDVKWPHPIAYGSVVAADFNKDGKMDLAFAAHLSRIYVLLGDGKGNFTDSDEGLREEFGSRRLVASDINADGYPDLIVISEGPTAVHSAPGVVAQIRAYINREKGKKWREVAVSGSQQRVAGDWLTAADFNGDKRVDLAAANIYMGSPDVMYLGQAGLKWKPVDPQMGRIIPYLSYYFASTAGKFTSKKRDDAIVSYVRFWPKDLNSKLVPTPPFMEVTGIDRVSFEDGNAQRTPIARWGNKFGVTGVAAADFDGDGNLDFAYTNSESPSERKITVMLGDGSGGFRRATVEGLVGKSLTTYDLKAADVNGDGRPDLIIMYEADDTGVGGSKGGSIHVFLNRGAQ